MEAKSPKRNRVPISGQFKTVFEFLKVTSATSSMVSAGTGIPQKNICRFKRMLEKSGKLLEVGKKRCKETGFDAMYLTTNPKLVQQESQLNLFGNDD